jgi:hypothetical protein
MSLKKGAHIHFSINGTDLIEENEFWEWIEPARLCSSEKLL